MMALGPHFHPTLKNERDDSMLPSSFVMEIKFRVSQKTLLGTMAPLHLCVCFLSGVLGEQGVCHRAGILEEFCSK